MDILFHADAGHGWLEVDKAELIKLGIAHKVSGFSYMKGDKAYLEEDCDATLYLNELSKAGHSFNFHEVYVEHSPIRNYQHYLA